MGGDHTCRSCGQMEGLAHGLACPRRRHGVVVTTDDVVYDPMAGYADLSRAVPGPPARRWTWPGVIFVLLIVVLAFTALPWVLLGAWHHAYQDARPLGTLVCGWLLCDWHNGRA